MPISTRKLLGIGVIVALVVALPLFIWAIVTQRFELRKKAVSGEPVNTIVCSSGMSDNFDGSSLDATKWSASVQTSQQDGGITISGLPGEDAFHGLMSNLWIDGDFQAEVDIKQFLANTSDSNDLATAELKAYADDGNFFTVRWVKWASGNSQVNLYSTVLGQTTQGLGVTIGTNSTPKLRLVRNGAVLRGYYNIGSGFQELPGISAALYTGLVRPTLFSYKRGAESIQAVFDNFSLGCIPSPSPPPVGGPPTPTPYVEGEPNSCGGTCGSNYNCKANLYCYQGFCRNPLCKEDVDCDCKTPTPKPTTSAKKSTTKPSPTMEIVFLSPQPSRSPRATITSRPTQTAIATAPEEPKNKLNFLLYIAGGSFLTAIVLLIANAFKKK